MVRLGLPLTLVLALGVGAGQGPAADTDFAPLATWDADDGGAWTEAKAGHLSLRSGTIRTPSLYEDFAFRFEYRVPRPDAGAMLVVRSHFDARAGVRGYGVVLEAGPGRGALRPGARTTAANTVRVDPPATRLADGQWTACEVRAEGDRLTVSLDGVVVSVGDRLDRQAGYLAFTGARGRGIELRGMRVATRTPAADGFAGLPDAAAPGITPPTVAHQEPLIFPDGAVQGGISGVVTVQIVIDPDGRVALARVLRTPHPDLVVAALTCARKWRFKPATKDGVPIVVTATMDLSFAFGKR